MRITDNGTIRHTLVVGDRVLLRPRASGDKTATGLYLPPGVQEKEQARSGYVVKVGPGYPIPHADDDEAWKAAEEQVKYMPLQAREGDLAIYLGRNSYDIELDGEKYVIVPHSAILLLIRDEDLFD